MLDGRADAAVHSAKDLPSAAHAGLVIAAFRPARRRRRADRPPLDELAGGRHRGHRVGARRGPSSRRCGPTCSSSSCAATSRPASSGAARWRDRHGRGRAAGARLTERIAERLDPAAFVPAVGSGLRRRRVARRRGATGERSPASTMRRRGTPSRSSGASSPSSARAARCPLGAHVEDGRLHIFLAPAPTVPSWSVSSPGGRTVGARRRPPRAAARCATARRGAGRRVPSSPRSGGARRSRGSPSHDPAPASSATPRYARRPGRPRPAIRSPSTIRRTAAPRCAVRSPAWRSFDWLVVTSPNGPAGRPGGATPPHRSAGRRRPATAARWRPAAGGRSTSSRRRAGSEGLLAAFPPPSGAAWPRPTGPAGRSPMASRRRATTS